MIQRFVFSGTGGQGILTAALIFAEAALYYEGLNAVQTQVYGPEARGGSARSDVIIADSEIWFPRVLQPNVLVCLSQTAYDKYSQVVRPGGVIVIDPHFVKRWVNATSRQVEVELRRAMVEGGSGDRSQAHNGSMSITGLNICLLGALSRLVPVVSLESIRKAVGDRFSEGDRAGNLQALEIGAGLITESVSTF